MRRSLILAILVLPGCGGCDRLLAPQPGNTVTVDPHKAFSLAPPPQGDQMEVTYVLLRISTIEVPVGTASGSEQMWSYLDEERIRGVRSASLGRNGIRAAVGSSKNWPDLVKILTTMTGRKLLETQVASMPGIPQAFTVKPDQPAQLIFTCNRDGTLSGADYPAGDNIIALTCSLDEDDRSRVMITAVPQIRSSQRQWEMVRDSGRLDLEPRMVVYSFYPMMFQVTMPSKDVLVIGPGAESGRPTSPGHHFLVKDREGTEFETVLVLIPEVVTQKARVDRVAENGDWLGSSPVASALEAKTVPVPISAPSP